MSELVTIVGLYTRPRYNERSTKKIYYYYCSSSSNNNKNNNSNNNRAYRKSIDGS